jgi:hypothetical protein
LIIQPKGYYFFSAETRRVAVELWTTKVPKKIMDQLQMSKATMMHCWLAVVLRMDDTQYLRNLVESLP